MVSTPTFEQATLPGVQAPININGDRLLDLDRPVHEWYRFVLSYPAHLVRAYLESFGMFNEEQ